MTARSRPPTDQQKTSTYDSSRDARAEVRGAAVEIGTPTEVTPPRQDAREGGAGASPEAASPGAVAGPERSEPLRVISMKAPRAAASEESQPVKQHKPRLRRLSEVSPQRRAAMTPPGGLGYIAPPRDPREVRTRRWREYVMWGSIVVILAAAVMLGVWFLAGM